MAAITAYLFFNGNCAEAMRFYERTLGAKIEMMMTHGEAPAADQAPQQDPKSIMHARLVGGGLSLMASDWMTGHPYPGMRGFALSLSYPTAAKAEAIFAALADGGEVRMAFGKTFWSPGFGMLADRYGTPWMVNTDPA